MKLRFAPFAMLLISISACDSFTISVQAQAYNGAQAAAYQNAKDWQGLLRYATAWSQADPNNCDAWFSMANAYTLGLNQPAQAVAPLKRCTEIEPNSAPVWHALGVTYLKAGQYGDAAAAIKKAIAINPNQPTYYNNLVAAYSDGNAIKSELATLDQEKALAQRMHNAEIWWNVGYGYTRATDINNAIAAFRQVLQIKSNYPQAWTALGIVLQASGDIAGARSAYQRGTAQGDPLAAKASAEMEADLRAQAAANARQQSEIQRGLNAYHMLEVLHLHIPGENY
jgi:protein O-GlcNAc transferase